MNFIIAILILDLMWAVYRDRIFIEFHHGVKEVKSVYADANITLRDNNAGLIRETQVLRSRLAEAQRIAIELRGSKAKKRAKA